MGREVDIGPFVRFKEKYLESVLSGKKRVTVRYGVVKPKLSLIYIVCCDKIYAEALITRVYYTELGKLGEEVVEAEGFTNREELINELREIYGEVGDRDIVTVIYFTVVRRYDKPVPLKKIK